MLLRSLLCAALLAPLAGAAQAVRTAPAAEQAQSAAYQRAQELGAALQRDTDALRAYLDDALAEGATPAAAQVLAARYRHGPPTEIHVSDGEANQASLVFRPERTGRLSAYLIEVEPAAPHRIRQVTAQPAAQEPIAVPAGEAERLARIDAVARRYADADVFSGVVLVAKDGRPVYQRAFGLADRTFEVPNRIDTKFNLGSMNKMFTAIAIAQLVEAGKVSLDDPLAKYLPDFPDAESAGKIRIKHLLSHTSGLNNYFNPEFMRSSPGRFRDIGSYMEVARTNAAMEFDPGTRWSYSNTGMLVLGRVIELASGEDYYDYVRRHIYEPAGMADSGSFETDAIVRNRATGYEMQFSPQGQRLRSGALATPARGSPAGGGYSTAPDLLKLAAALRSGRLIKPETLALFASPKPELASPMYGYGFSRERGAAEGRDIFGHGGDFPDGTCANLAMFADADGSWTAIVLANGTVIASCHAISRTIAEMIPPKGQ